MPEIRQNGAREKQSKLCSDELQMFHKMYSSTGVDSDQRKLTFLHPRFPTANSCIRAPYVGRTWLPCTRVLVEGHDYPAPEYCWRDMLSCTLVLLEGHGYPVPKCCWGDMVILYPGAGGRTLLSCTRVPSEGHGLSCTRVVVEGHGYPAPQYCWREMLSCTRILLEGHGYPVPAYCWRDIVYPVPENGWRDMVILYPNTVGGTCLFCTRALWQRRDDQSPCTPVLWRKT